MRPIRFDLRILCAVACESQRPLGDDARAGRRRKWAAIVVQWQIDANRHRQHRRAELRALRAFSDFVEHNDRRADRLRRSPIMFQGSDPPNRPLAIPRPSAWPAAASSSGLRVLRRWVRRCHRPYANRLSTGAITRAQDTEPIASISCCFQGVAPTMLAALEVLQVVARDACGRSRPRRRS